MHSAAGANQLLQRKTIALQPWRRKFGWDDPIVLLMIDMWSQLIQKLTEKAEALKAVVAMHKFK